MISMERAPLAHSPLSSFPFLLSLATLLLYTHAAPLISQRLEDAYGVAEIRQLPNGSWEYEIELTDGDQDDSLHVTGDKVTNVPANAPSTISCEVSTDVDHEFIKTFWFKQVSILNSSQEWRRQHHSDFTSGTMSLPVTIKKTTLYKCKACITRKPASLYKRSFSGGDQCEDHVIEVRPLHE